MQFYVTKIDNFELVDIVWQNDIDSDTLPIACEVAGKFYNLYGINSDSYIVFIVDSLAEVLNLSVKHAKGIKFTDISRLASTCYEVDVDVTDIDIFTEMKIKGDRNFKALRKVSQYPDALQRYIDDKNIPFKILNLISSMSDKSIEFISQYVADKTPSLQMFKSFVENVSDFRELVQSDTYSSSFSFPSKKSSIRTEIESRYHNAQSSVKPINLSNYDMFETSNISISFTARDIREYTQCLDKLQQSKDEVATLYKLLDDNDIC